MPAHTPVYVVTTYSEFSQWMKDFAANKFNFLAVIGPPGTGKSTYARMTMKNKDHWFHSGTISDRCFYEALYEHKDKPTILDDVNSLLSSLQIATQVNSLVQTDSTKTITYAKKNLGTKSVVNEEDEAEIVDLPSSFQTKSKVCFIANGITRRLPATLKEAITDKSTMIRFNPSAAEIHNYAGTYFLKKHKDKDAKEIYAWIGNHLDIFAQHSLRSYERAWELRERDWKNYLIMSCSSDPIRAKFIMILKKHKLHTRDGKQGNRGAVKLALAECLKFGIVNNEKTFHNWKGAYLAGEFVIRPNPDFDIFM